MGGFFVLGLLLPGFTTDRSSMVQQLFPASMSFDQRIMSFLLLHMEGFESLEDCLARLGWERTKGGKRRINLLKRHSY